jgi:hypothetical protein
LTVPEFALNVPEFEKLPATESVPEGAVKVPEEMVRLAGIVKGAPDVKVPPVPFILKLP